MGSEQSVPTSLCAWLCESIPEEELIQILILKGKELLAKYGLLDGEGRVNKTLLLALLDVTLQEETMKETVLNYILKHYKKELQERLGQTLPRSS